MGKFVDLVGKQFGKWKVLSLTKEKDTNGSVKWECVCECGTVKNISTSYLKSGKVVMCKKCIHDQNKKDLVGKKFGRLTVKKYDCWKRENDYWECECDCGKSIKTSAKNLIQGRVQSCGCKKAELNGEKAKQIQETNAQIKFKNSMLCQFNRAKANSNSPTGHNGIRIDKKTGKYTAHITVQRKPYYLGSFWDIEEAIKARARAEEEKVLPLFEEFKAVQND